MRDWVGFAKCGGSDVDPTLDGICNTNGERQLFARRYCAGCEVIVECARDAIANDDMGVIRAGVFLHSRRDRGGRSHNRSALRSVIVEAQS